MSAQTKLNEIAQEFELPGTIVRLFGELHELSPEMAQRLLDKLRTVVHPSNGSVIRRPRGKANRSKYTRFERLALMFSETGNEPKTKGQMAEDSGLTAHQIHTLIYTSHTDSLKKLDAPDGSRAKLYQLTPAALETAKGGHNASQ